MILAAHGEEEGGGAEADELFALGHIVSTPGALQAIPEGEITHALSRHHRGDWGELDEEDMARNNGALVKGERLFSQYVSQGGVKFWIITEGNRSVTTVLLPEEY